MSLWLGVPSVAMVVGWLLGRWRGVLIALATSVAWLGTVRLAVSQGSLPDDWPSLSALVAALAITCITLGLAVRLRKTSEWVKRSRSHNPVTGLVEAESFGEVVQLELHRALRYDRPFSLLYLRCDSVGHDHRARAHRPGPLGRLGREPARRRVRGAPPRDRRDPGDDGGPAASGGSGDDRRSWAGLDRRGRCGHGRRRPDRSGAHDRPGSRADAGIGKGCDEDVPPRSVCGSLSERSRLA